jgi:hypothetical protein
MYCSTCGTRNESGHPACEGCGTPLRGQDPRLPGVARTSVPPSQQVPICPRCGYEGGGITYFSRGSHVAALIGATVLTAGVMGAGGIVYYIVRRDHRICPRCAHGWGRFGERALIDSPQQRLQGAQAPGRGGERAKRRASVLLFIVAAFLVIAGIGGGEAVPIFFALFAVMGGVALHIGANNARDARRAELVGALQPSVLKLAADRGGRLTVTQVAAALGWPLPRAEKVLNSLDDGLRVDSEVTDEGVIVYEFRELLGPPDGESPRLPGI